jgi:superfamily I DNA/RNA helicase
LSDRFQQLAQPKAAQGFRGLTNLLIDFNDRVERQDMTAVGEVFKDLIDHMGYLDWVSTNDDHKQKDRRRRNLKDLVGWLARLGREELSKEAFLARLSLVAGPDDDRHEGKDVVRLMTLHAVVKRACCRTAEAWTMARSKKSGA